MIGRCLEGRKGKPIQIFYATTKEIAKIMNILGKHYVYGIDSTEQKNNIKTRPFPDWILNFPSWIMSRLNGQEQALQAGNV